MLGSERGKELVVKIADFLLCYRGERVDRIEPCVEGWLLGQRLEAGILEVGSILHTIDVFDELGSLWEDFGVIRAKIIDISIEIVHCCGVFRCYECSIC